MSLWGDAVQGLSIYLDILTLYLRPHPSGCCNSQHVKGNQLPTIYRLEDNDAAFALAESTGKITVINNLPIATEDDKERIRELTITQLKSDSLSTVPICSPRCAKPIRGRWALGKKCPTCGNLVTAVMDNRIKSDLWFTAPKGVEALINPVIINMLGSYFTKSYCNMILWLTDGGYTPGGRIPSELLKLQEYKFERNLNFFVQNFDEIFEVLCSIMDEKPKKTFAKLREFIQNNREVIFPKAIPLMSKTMLIADKTNVGIFMEESVENVLDTIYHLVSIDRDFHDKRPEVVMNRTARQLGRLAKFYHDYAGTNMQKKHSHMRRGLYGHRNIFSGRGVISSDTGNHRHDELGMPWRIAVPIFQHHLVGMLMKKGFRQNHALKIVMDHVNVYSTRMHGMLDDLFGQFYGGRGPSCILHRN